MDERFPMTGLERLLAVLEDEECDRPPTAEESLAVCRALGVDVEALTERIRQLVIQHSPPPGEPEGGLVPG